MAENVEIMHPREEKTNKTANILSEHSRVIKSQYNQKDHTYINI